jgi:hypothetical protein
VSVETVKIVKALPPLAELNLSGNRPPLGGNTIGRIQELSARSRSYVLQHYGEDLKWEAINSALWNTIRSRPAQAITLTDVTRIADAVSADPDEVLSILAFLVRPGLSLLEMKYFAGKGGASAIISNEDVQQRLKAWWKDKSLDDDAWRAWASKVIVKWIPRISPGMLNE